MFGEIVVSNCNTSCNIASCNMCHVIYIVIRHVFLRTSTVNTFCIKRADHVKTPEAVRDGEISPYFREISLFERCAYHGNLVY